MAIVVVVVEVGIVVVVDVGTVVVVEVLVDVVVETLLVGVGPGVGDFELQESANAATSAKTRRFIDSRRARSDESRREPAPAARQASNFSVCGA
jgi:hypothetical protein